MRASVRARGHSSRLATARDAAAAAAAGAAVGAEQQRCAVAHLLVVSLHGHHRGGQHEERLRLRLRQGTGSGPQAPYSLAWSEPMAIADMTTDFQKS